MSHNLVEVRGLRKEFGKVVAVRDLSFETKRGEILGLLGVNGAGKTTTIQMLLGLITPTSGNIKIFDTDMQHDRIKILQRVNFASAYQSLPDSLKIRENLFIFAEIYNVKNSKKKIDDLLEMFELSHFRDRLTGKLSSGEKTRLNLCKAMLNDPELLILDEPTASLDPDMADKVRKILLKMHKEKGMTIINTSHNMIDVMELCDRILFMQHGEIVANGTADQILEQYKSESLEEVFITLARSSASESAIDSIDKTIHQ